MTDVILLLLINLECFVTLFPVRLMPAGLSS